jgi:hypothetical protein
VWEGGFGRKKQDFVGELEGLCSSKVEGGLGVKDLKWFNASLLAKWCWRMLSEEGSF